MQVFKSKKNMNKNVKLLKLKLASFLITLITQRFIYVSKQNDIK